MRFFLSLAALTLVALAPLSSVHAANSCSDTMPFPCDENAGPSICTCDLENISMNSMAEGVFPQTVAECREYCKGASNEEGRTFHFRCTISDGRVYDRNECLVDLAASPTDPTAAPLREPIIPTLNVKIPGFDEAAFSTSVYRDNEAISANFIGIYFNAVYGFLIIGASLLAVLMITLAGFQWTTARGKAGDVQAAKDKIKNILIGITLLLVAVSLASLIDPNLTTFRPLQMDTIDPIAYVNESGDTEAGAGGVDIEYAKSIGIDCQAGASIYNIAKSTKGKVSYRMGGKLGVSYPYKYETKKDSDGRPYSSYCPTGTLCLDCSGYADFLAKCSNLPSLGGSTSAIFSASNLEKADPRDCKGDSINGLSLRPGDVVGWSTKQIPKGSKTNYGHVFTYIGNSQVADSHGSGRPAGTAVGIYSLSDICSKYATKDHGLYVVRR